jgi:hypothetical protein
VQCVRAGEEEKCPTQRQYCDETIQMSVPLREADRHEKVIADSEWTGMLVEGLCGNPSCASARLRAVWLKVWCVLFLPSPGSFIVVRPFTR